MQQTRCIKGDMAMDTKAIKVRVADQTEITIGDPAFFYKAAERKAIERARRTFFARGGKVTRYTTDGFPMLRYSVGAFGKVMVSGLSPVPLPA